MDRAIAILLQSPGMPPEMVQDHLQELLHLAKTANIEVPFYFIYKKRPVVPATYLSSGRIAQVKAALERYKANMILVDLPLTPVQIRNLERCWGVRVMERTNLILTIFERHAKTAQAKLQVALAHLQYMLPRLTRMWTHLSRERGGIGLKGAGEKEIETDRRRIRHQIAVLKRKLKKIEQQNRTARKQRSRRVRVALVGYTNAGKSSLMRRLSKASVVVEDKLFATLDTTVRRVTLEDTTFLLSDTVGFIRALPPTLIESFKSTLAEVYEADILLQVTDVSHPYYMEYMHTVQKILSEMKVLHKPIIHVLNKIDLLSEEERLALENEWQSFIEEGATVVMVSARSGEGIEHLRRCLVEKVRDCERRKGLRVS